MNLKTRRALGRQCGHKVLGEHALEGDERGEVRLASNELWRVSESTWVKLDPRKSSGGNAARTRPAGDTEGRAARVALAVQQESTWEYCQKLDPCKPNGGNDARARPTCSAEGNAARVGDGERTSAALVLDAFMSASGFADAPTSRKAASTTVTARRTAMVTVCV